MRIGRRRFSVISLACLMVMILWSCAGFWPERSGRIVPDGDAARIFEKNQCGADYSYYYSGSALYPHAMMGIRQDIKLEDDTLWKKVHMTPERCKEMVAQMQTRALGLGLFPYGFVIQDDRGRPIGIWYAIMTTTTFVSMRDDHTAVIHTPPVDTYTRYEKDPQ